MTENLDPELPIENLPETTSDQNVAEESPKQSEVPTIENTIENNDSPDKPVDNAIDNEEPMSVAEPVAENSESAQPEAAKTETHPLSKDEIITKLKDYSQQAGVPARGEVDNLKYAFYKIRTTEVEDQKTKFIEGGGVEEDFVPTPDPSEDVLKTFLSEIKDKRARLAAQEDQLREENLTKKLGIIDAIKQLTESTDDFNKLYNDFKDLQQKWNEIKLVPAAKVKDLWNAYQAQTEKFYDLIKINNEFRDYDFKKNLELKTAICESVEKLIEEADDVSAFHQLQNFHNQWREIGPVAKELREELWTRFKAASTEINKKYQSHFEDLKSREEENLSEKTAIIEQLKIIVGEEVATLKAWDEKSKEVIDLQSKWKTIGFVPRKLNTQIFEEFRALCDKFFESKSQFFKHIKDDMEANLRRKRELCEQANAMKDSTDWKKTTDEMIAIQKEWKTIGPVPRKYSDVVWKEFVTACDYFFEQKNKNFSSQKQEETANLAAKKEIIEKIKAIDTSLPASDAIALVKELADEWHNIGFVPFKEKDKIYKEFHQAVDAHYDRLKVDKNERRMDSFRSNIDDLSKSGNAERKLLREREKLMHIYSKLKGDLQTYENNMSFLSISSKSGNSLLKDINLKIDDLKNEMKIIEEKVNALDQSLNSMEG